MSLQLQGESTILDCLNIIENIKVKNLMLSKYSKSFDSDFKELKKNLKEHLLTLRINNQTFQDMQKQINCLTQQKQAIITRNEQMLTTLQMLIYENNTPLLKERISTYKKSIRNQSSFTYREDEEKQLNQAFVLQSGLKVFENFDCKDQQTNRQDSDQKTKVKKALQIIESNNESFNKKQSIWLDIIYNSDKNKSQRSSARMVSRDISEDSMQDISQIGMTQVKDTQRFGTGEFTFSGKKIKSMIVMKDKSSSKKKSLPKTSVKKNMLNKKGAENIEVDDNKSMKKKLTFVSKSSSQQRYNPKKNVKVEGLKTKNTQLKSIINYL